VPVITPFDSELCIDFDSFKSHLDFLYTNGIRAFVIGGTTGEGLTLTKDEVGQLMSIAKTYKEVELWACVVSFSKMMDFTHLHQADYLLVMPQFFVRPGQHDVLDFYKLILEKTCQNIVMYNNPVRTGVSIAEMYPELLELSERIIGVKETVFSNLPSIRFWYGDDVAAAEQAGYGLISATANVEPNLSQKISHHICTAEEKNEWLKLAKDMFAFPNPLCIKRRLKEMGVIRNDITRFPISIYK